jgi:4-nitrophenyl phosphatase
MGFFTGAAKLSREQLLLSISCDRKGSALFWQRIIRRELHSSSWENWQVWGSRSSYLASIAPPGARVFVVGMEGLRAALSDEGFRLVDDDAEFVVAGMDFTICYERLAQATLQIRAGARFIGTNPDRTFPSERGIVPGAGSLLAFLEAATGVEPLVIGKPETAMVEQALAQLRAKPATAAMLGDRLETDILAGQRAGLHTLLVLSGVTERAMLADSQIQPDLVFEGVAHLHAVWAESVGGHTTTGCRAQDA